MYPIRGGHPDFPAAGLSWAMARILVIDDSSPLDVVERIKSNRPDLVLTDYHMPHVDGLQVARLVRRADAGVTVVMLTSMHDPALEAGLATAGVRHILHKPMTGEALVKALEEILGG
jgi:two-component system chemotaxis response regulator CheY